LIDRVINYNKTSPKPSSFYNSKIQNKVKLVAQKEVLGYNTGMGSVTISKTEYTALKVRASAYERMLVAAESAFSLNPPVRSKKKIMTAFKATKKYSKEFLNSLNQGLSRSSYFEA